VPTPAPVRIARPAPADVPAGYEGYLSRVPGEDALADLAAQGAEVQHLLGSLPEERARHRYAPGKWSVKEVVGHLCDNERVFAYRALRFARGDATPLANYEEDDYVRAGRFDRRTLPDLLDELGSIREATLSLYRTFDEEALDRVGTARGLRMSARTVCWVTAGHVRHHLAVLRDRYGIA
jgi:hypothetical protein